MTHRLSLERIATASSVIDPVFLDSPQFRAESLEAVLGCRLIVKVETVNPIRSFKGRGASLYASTLRAGDTVVTASAGNFGQAVAYACRSRGARAIIFASVNANSLKVDRMRAFGADVRLHGDDFDAAKVEAKRHAAAHGLPMLEDGLEPATAEGAATIAVELLRCPSAKADGYGRGIADGYGSGEAIDDLLVPLGNGALLTGVGRWTKAHAPTTQVIGVAAAGAPAMVESWRSGRIVTYDRIDTIADGIGVRVPIPEAVADMQGTVDDAVLVTDASIVAAMRLAHEHLGLVIEPSGAAGLAAILEDPARYRGRCVATILCGGNVR